MLNKVVGSKVMIIGDLHFSDVYTGRHKGYLENCFWCLARITEKLRETKPCALVICGDIVGWSETNVRNRQVFSMFCRVLRDWNEVCPVYSVRGNHDIKGYPDFQFLSEFGLLITSSMCGGYFDYYGYDGQDVPEVRFHIVDYKDENRPLDLHVGTSNIVLGHNNYTINGVTTWYSEHDGIELNMLGNYSGVDMVISGHIHNPSPEIYSTQMQNGEKCMLFYPGCPMRPVKDNNMYESCWYVFARYSGSETDIDTEVFELRPSDEVFYSKDEFVTEKTQDEVEDALRKAALKDVLDDLMKYRISMGSPIDHIKNIPNATDEAKELACRYLQIAFNNEGGTK